MLEVIDDLEWMPRRHTLDERQSREHGTEVYRLVFERGYEILFTANDVTRQVVIVSFAHGRQRRELYDP